MCAYPCYPCSSYLTGDSSRKRTKGYTRKRHFIQNEHGVGVDETIIAREAREAARGPAVRGRRAPKVTSSKPSRKGKETRPNYKTMDLIQYAGIRQSNWYNTPRDEQIDDPNFWCMEQSFIYRDIYLDYRHPIRPMQPYRMQDIKAKPKFAQAAEVLEEMGLAPLIELQCPYNVPLVLQFFSTLVIEGDVRRTMKWMSGRTQCTSSFQRFGSLLGYTFCGEPPAGRRMHTMEKPNNFFTERHVWH